MSEYEKSMVGQHPSSKAPHHDYEGRMMKGEHGKAPSKSADGTVGRIKMAAGGVGKLRKGEMTSSGMPSRKAARHKLGE